MLPRDFIRGLTWGLFELDCHHWCKFLLLVEPFTFFFKALSCVLYKLYVAGDSAIFIFIYSSGAKYLDSGVSYVSQSKSWSGYLTGSGIYLGSFIKMSSSSSIEMKGFSLALKWCFYLKFLVFMYKALLSLYTDVWDSLEVVQFYFFK